MINDIMFWIFENILGPMMLFLVLVAFFIGIPAAIYGVYQVSQKPTFDLKKESWRCTRDHTETHCAKGCHTETICDQWTAK